MAAHAFGLKSIHVQKLVRIQKRQAEINEGCMPSVGGGERRDGGATQVEAVVRAILESAEARLELPVADSVLTDHLGGQEQLMLRQGGARKANIVNQAIPAALNLTIGATDGKMARTR